MSSDGNLLTYAAIGLVLFGAYRCTRSNEATESDAFVGGFSNSLPADREDWAEEAALAAVKGTTYEDQGAPYGCTDDCSGHDAGYDWAAENGVTDTSDCGGDSQSFVEGCEAYAEAYASAMEEALDEE